jgi:cytochrome c
MKRITLTALALALSFGMGTAVAQDAKKGEAAAKANGCLGCHDVAKKKVGPALKEVAAKNKATSVDALAGKIKAAGPHSDIKLGDDDLKNIAAWVKTL